MKAIFPFISLHTLFSNFVPALRWLGILPRPPPPATHPNPTNQQPDRPNNHPTNHSSTLATPAISSLLPRVCFFLPLLSIYSYGLWSSLPVSLFLCDRCLFMLVAYL
ncbi:hypothetical protein DFJ73DRAFT_816552, partial [Zopfochytrium polystomum]